MSVAEFPRPSDDELPDRLPPQDVGAEQSVLGAMLLSKDAIADVVESLRETDFYRPTHQTIYGAVLDLYGRGEPADAITVAAHLGKSGELARIGGAPYLHTLVAGVPTAANASYYARIVSEKAVLRRLVQAGTRITQMGYTADGEVDDIVDRAQAEVYDVTERRMSEDYRPLSSLMNDALAEIEAIGNRGGQMVGVPTGFTELDRYTNGLHPGQLVIVAARPGMGKALALDTPVPTPDGWTTMGEVQVGDRVMGADGLPTTVVAATDVMLGRPCFLVEFSDGSTIVADAEHQWETTTRAERRTRQVESTQSAVRRRPLDDESLLGINLAPTMAQPSDVMTSTDLARVMRCSQSSSSVQATMASVGAVGLMQRTRSAQALIRRETALLSAGIRYARPLFNDQRPKESAGPAIRTTKQIAATITCADGRSNHAVRLAEPLNLPMADLALPPYVLGAWLGDGTSAAAQVMSGDPELADLLTAEGVRCEHRGGMRYSLLGTSRSDSIKRLLRDLGVLNNKHIPAAYLRASVEQRRALLAGLLDTDGTVDHTGLVQFTTTSPRLADDAHELILSLGYRVGRCSRRVAGRSQDSGTAHTLSFTTDDSVFRLTRKSDAHADLMAGRAPHRRDLRYITRVTPMQTVPVRCIEVDNADHLYLAGRAMIPTHNSTLGLDIARTASIKNGLTSAIFSLEMSRNEIVMRLLSAEAQIALHAMRSGTMGDNDWSRLARKMSAVSEAPLYIDDSPNLTMMEIRAKARRLRQRHDLRLVVVDYLQLMTSGRKVESRQQEVSEFSRQMKLLAKELEVPVIAISQLNRGPEQRTDKKPMLADLRESGSLEQDADAVILIHREDFYEKESPRAGEADFILAKHRNGPTGNVTVAFQGHYSRFVDMAAVQ